MSKLRDVEFDGVVRSDYIKESDGKLTIKHTQDVEPVLKKNKQLITLNAVSYTHLTLPTNREV